MRRLSCETLVLVAGYLVASGTLMGQTVRPPPPPIRDPAPMEVADSLEWLTWDCDLIVLGYPHRLQPDVMRIDDRTFEAQATIEVQRVLYGEYNAGSLSFSWKTDRVTPMDNRPQLFFLKRSSSQRGESYPTLWTLRRSVLPSASSQGLPTATGGLARTADEVMTTVENEAANRTANSSQIHVDPGPDNFSRTKTLAQGCFNCVARKGAVILEVSPRRYLVVPAYPRFQEYAIHLCQSVDFDERVRGAYMLRSYPGEATAQVLMSLLYDDGAYRWNMSSTAECATYTVRAAAYDVLRDQGVVVPKPLLDECHNR